MKHRIKLVMCSWCWHIFAGLKLPFMSLLNFFFLSFLISLCSCPYLFVICKPYSIVHNLNSTTSKTFHYWWVLRDRLTVCSAERCIRPPFCFHPPPFLISPFRNMDHLDNHHRTKQDYLMIHWNQGDWKQLI